jgi:hypothetical protein
MSDFKINCPHCQQSLEAPEDMMGETIECPSCTGTIHLPSPEPKPQPRPKLIVKTRSTALPSVAPQRVETQTVVKRASPGSGIFIFLLSLPFIALAAIGFMIEEGGLPLILIFGGIAIALILWGCSKFKGSTSRTTTEHSGESTNAVRVIVGVLVMIGSIWYFYGGGMEKQVAKDMSQIEKQVAADAVKQYEIAKRSGSIMDAYVHAGIVSAAFLQAKDEANYQKWKAIERQEGLRAGMSPDMLK